ncbi:glycosyltransferase [uncultured Methylobacterium sp.]|uniref:glycosyltransferase n=1 Tax=uncultured Methylobacterium sp. TaxID=157278 RepID=UPI00262EC685|nr:glycosyltransferase [uncultured Methylobacterium sp.]
MIFVTVGVQLPFDRLIKAVDEWAGRNGGVEVVAQAGESGYVPRHLQRKGTLPATEYRALVEKADLIVGHAGMGSIITALELGKQIVVVPRRADLGEHRNDHQKATARYMAAQNLVTVAENEDDLLQILDGKRDLLPQRSISGAASPELIGRLRSFLDEKAPAKRR